MVLIVKVFLELHRAGLLLEIFDSLEWRVFLLLNTHTLIHHVRRTLHGTGKGQTLFEIEALGQVFCLLALHVLDWRLTEDALLLDQIFLSTRTLCLHFLQLRVTIGLLDLIAVGLKGAEELIQDGSTLGQVL